MFGIIISVIVLITMGYLILKNYKPQVVLNLLLVRSGREEQAMMTTLAGLVVVLMMLVQQISDLFQLVKTLFGL